MRGRAKAKEEGKSAGNTQLGAVLVAPTQPPVMGPAVSADLLAEHLSARGWHVERVVTRARRPIHITGHIHPANITGALRAWAAFWRASGTPRVDVVWLSLTEARLGAIRDLGVVWMARWRHLPMVVHLLGGNYQSFYSGQPKAIRRFISWSLAHVEAGIVIDPSLVSCLECVLPSNRIAVVANGVEVAPARPNRTLAGADALRILYLSTIWIEKGILDFVRAAGIVLRQTDRPIELLLAGEVFPHDWVIAKQLMFDNGIEDRFHFVGTVTGKRKVDILHATDIFVFASHLSEAHPLVVLEAMMVGLPVVATDVGDLRNTLPAEGRPYLVPPGSPNDLARTILELVEDPERRTVLGRINRAKALAEYCTEVYGSGVAAVLRGAIDGMSN